MATRNTSAGNDLTKGTEIKESNPNDIRIPVMLPELESADGLSVDQVEHMSISNETGDNFIRIRRGERVEVTPEQFILLKQRYPKI